MNFVRVCRRNSRAVFLLVGVLTLAGLVSVFQLPSNIYPELNFPRIIVLVHAGDLSPDTMLVTVTRPIEEQVSTVFGVRRVRSRTIRGGAEISVLFSQDADMTYASSFNPARANHVTHYLVNGDLVSMRTTISLLRSLIRRTTQTAMMISLAYVFRKTNRGTRKRPKCSRR